jgi:hypothetical protein
MKHRHEPRNVGDLVHLLRNHGDAPTTIAEKYATRLTAGEHAEPLQWALATLEETFCDLIGQ